MVLLIALAGGLGAVGRLVVDGVVRAHTSLGDPDGITLVNVTGSFVLGLATALLADGGGALAVVGVGFCGGYTTFSTAMVDGVNLVRDGRLGRALVTVGGTLAASVAATGLGLVVGGALAG
ncbi:fluoride efflux transporter FluC [Georgenia yuyongxinii]